MIKSLIIPILVAADQGIKYYVRQLPRGEVFFCIPGFVELVPSANTGAAFSLLSGHTFFLAGISACLLAGLLIYLKRAMHLTSFAEILSLILIGGGIGNLIDRLFFGSVTDYIRILLFRFPIFNLADIAITCSVFGLIVLMITGKLEIDSGESHGTDD